MAELFTLDEAAAIAEIEPDTVRTALEKRAVTPSRKVKTGKAVRYRFSEGDVLYLLVMTEFPFPLSKDDRLPRQGPGAREQDRETLDVRWAGPRLSLGRHEDMD